MRLQHISGHQSPVLEAGAQLPIRASQADRNYTGTQRGGFSATQRCAVRLPFVQQELRVAGLQVAGGALRILSHGGPML